MKADEADKLKAGDLILIAEWSYPTYEHETAPVEAVAATAPVEAVALLIGIKRASGLTPFPQYEVMDQRGNIKNIMRQQIISLVDAY